MSQFHNFYDTETTGANPRFDQVLQAAAILTDDDFVEQEWIDERSRLAGHMVPSAGALKVTHVDPYDIAKAEHSAFDFARMLSRTFSGWAERGDMSYCGYNTIRFDEEIMRQMFWENLLDPYLTSGKGTGRNDLLTVVRALYARNPECIDIPKNPDNGKNSFKLEAIAPMNGFDGHDAHDALGDVRATIHLARLIRDTDPALWEHMMLMGNAKTATNFADEQVLFRMLGGAMLEPGVLDCCLISSEATNPKNKSAWNLAVDPMPFLDMAPEQILDAMKKTNTPFRTLKCNKQPAVFPIGWEFLNRVSNDAFVPADNDTIEMRAEIITMHDGFKANVAEALRLRTESYQAPETLEEKIYSGFASWDDKARLKSFHDTSDWSRRLEIVRNIEKPELRALGIRTIYLHAPQTLSEPIRTACAERIAEERHTLDIDKPWNTVGTLMLELDERQATDPDDPELANIRKWALETYEIAHEWTGKPEPEKETPVEADAQPEATADASETEVQGSGDQADDQPCAKVKEANKPAKTATVKQVEAAQISYLDGLA
jgi:exodeoxyribonuclease-1